MTLNMYLVGHAIVAFVVFIVMLYFMIREGGIESFGPLLALFVVALMWPVTIPVGIAGSLGERARARKEKAEREETAEAPKDK